MEEEIEGQRLLHHQQQQHPPPSSTATTTTTTRLGDGKGAVVTCTGDTGDKVPATGTMGGFSRNAASGDVNVTGVGLMGEEEAGSQLIRTLPATTITTPTTPRQPSKRDSGYHTDCSPATLTLGSTPQPHFTFDSPPGPNSALLPVPPTSPSEVEQGSRPQGSQRPGTPRGGTLSSRSSPPLREPREGEGDDLADVDTKEGGDNDDKDDDNDDDDAFVSDHAEGAASSPWPIHLPSVLSTPHRGALRAQPLDKLRDRYGQGDDHKPLVCLREEDSGDGQRDEREDSVDGGRRHVARPNDDLDGDDDLDSDEGEDEDGRGGVASTTYRHGPLLMHVTLPGGGRLRPLVARTTSTQTPHLHCQLMDQVLAGPPDLPHSVRGNVVRRLRYYSEGEGSTGGLGTSLPSHGPLPDIVPISAGQAARERSQSVPNLETMQRQRATERAVGRELRRMSDELVRSREAARENPRLMGLAAVHAEVMGVTTLFLTGVRRLVIFGLGAYVRHLVQWTPPHPSPARTPSPARQPRDSCVDEER